MEHRSTAVVSRWNGSVRDLRVASRDFGHSQVFKDIFGDSFERNVVLASCGTLAGMKKTSRHVEDAD